MLLMAAGSFGDADPSSAQGCLSPAAHRQRADRAQQRLLGTRPPLWLMLLLDEGLAN
jgi:hypothetical protein